MQTKKEKRKDAEVSIVGVLPKERVESEIDPTLSGIQSELEIPGFRRGKVPLEKVREYVGEKDLWKEAAESAMRKEVESILKEHEVLPVMPIGASLKPSEVGTDVPFEIIAVVAPTCDVGDYKKTAEDALRKLEPLDVAKEKELAIVALRQQARAMTKSQSDPSSELGAKGPLTDDEAKKLGMENAKAAELFVVHEAEHAIENRENQRKRGAIAEALIEKASCDIPKVMVMEEVGALLDATKKDIAARGLPWNEYLKESGKTDESVAEELGVPALKRVALDLIFGEIARTEKISVDEKEVERLAHVLQSQGVDHDQAHRYVHATVMREKVWELLGAKSVTHDHGPAETNDKHPSKASESAVS